jgi:hypothetical protein
MIHRGGQCRALKDITLKRVHTDSRLAPD